MNEMEPFGELIDSVEVGEGVVILIVNCGEYTDVMPAAEARRFGEALLKAADEAMKRAEE